MKKDFSKGIVDKIKKENIKQTPKYIFVLKHLSVWFFLVFSVIIWALALSISLGYFSDIDWSLGYRLWFIKILVVYMPLFWIFFLLISMFFSYYNFRHTERGYRFSFMKIFFINVFSSILLGMLLYFSWISFVVEWVIEDVVPKYRSLLVEDKASRMVSIWQDEDRWLLIWEIVEVNEWDFTFIDYNEKQWNILFDGDTVVRWRVNLEVWEKVKIIWEKVEDSVFEAGEIKPFMGRWKG